MRCPRSCACRSQTADDAGGACASGAADRPSMPMDSTHFGIAQLAVHVLIHLDAGVARRLLSTSVAPYRRWVSQAMKASNTTPNTAYPSSKGTRQQNSTSDTCHGHVEAALEGRLALLVRNWRKLVRS